LNPSWVCEYDITLDVCCLSFVYHVYKKERGVNLPQVILLLLLSLSFSVSAEETSVEKNTAELVSSQEVVEMISSIDITDPSQVAELVIDNPNYAVEILQRALYENTQNIENFVSQLLQSEPVLVNSLISASVNLKPSLTSNVISSAKNTLPKQEQEIVFLALAEGIDPQLVTEPTAAGTTTDNVEETSTEEVVNNETETVLADNQNEIIELSSPPLSGGNGVASPN